MRSCSPQIKRVGASISGRRFSSRVLPSGQKARAAASLARVCSIGHSGRVGAFRLALELAPAFRVGAEEGRDLGRPLRPRVGHRVFFVEQAPGRDQRQPAHSGRPDRRDLRCKKRPPTELPARSAPSSAAFCSSCRTASTQSRWLSSTVWPRSPPGKPGSDGTMTVRSRAQRVKQGDPPRQPAKTGEKNRALVLRPSATHGRKTR